MKTLDQSLRQISEDMGFYPASPHLIAFKIVFVLFVCSAAFTSTSYAHKFYSLKAFAGKNCSDLTPVQSEKGLSLGLTRLDADGDNIPCE